LPCHPAASRRHGLVEDQDPKLQRQRFIIRDRDFAMRFNAPGCSKGFFYHPDRIIDAEAKCPAGEV
jgi:hypothetical protein